MSDEIPRLVAHGRLTVKPEIERYDGGRVIFNDGSSERLDVIVFATGYRPVIPFIEESLAFTPEGRPRFLANTVHEEHEGLFAAGLVQANGSIWRLADYQGQLIANMIIAQAKAPQLAQRSRAALAAHDRSDKHRFVASERHRLEVNYFDYRRFLKRQIRRFGRIRKLKLAAENYTGITLPPGGEPITANPGSWPQRSEAPSETRVFSDVR
jgi:hypothetical protein